MWNQNANLEKNFKKFQTSFRGNTLAIKIFSFQIKLLKFKLKFSEKAKFSKIFETLLFLMKSLKLTIVVRELVCFLSDTVITLSVFFWTMAYIL